MNRPVPVTIPTCRTPIAELGKPLGDLHAVDELDRADLCVAEERRADTAMLIALEADGDSVVHPIDVLLDQLDDAPDLCG